MGKDWTRSFEGMLTDRHARHNTSLPTRGKVTKKSTTLMKTTAKTHHWSRRIYALGINMKAAAAMLLLAHAVHKSKRRWTKLQPRSVTSRLLSPATTRINNCNKGSSLKAASTNRRKRRTKLQRHGKQMYTRRTWLTTAIIIYDAEKWCYKLIH